MAKTRALLTDTERERLAGLTDVDDIKIYQAKSRVRRRIDEELSFDVEILRQNEPDLFDELCDVVLEEMERAEEREGSGDELRQEMEDTLAELSVTGRPQDVEDTRRDAIKYAWETLREAGEMQPKDLADKTFYEFEDRNLGYSASSSRYDGYQMWDSCVREVLGELPGVQPGSGSGGWRFSE